MAVSGLATEAGLLHAASRHAEARWRAAQNAASESSAGNNGEAGALHQPRIGNPRDILACGARRSLRGDARGLVTK